MTLGPLMIDVAGQVLTPDEVDRLKDSRIGGVILFARNCDNWEQMKALVAAIHAVRTPSLLVAVDQEGGRIQRFREGFTALPPARRLGHRYDIDPPAFIRRSSIPQARPRRGKRSTGSSQSG